MINCKNCGAPIKLNTNKCPYCDTPYEAPGASKMTEKLIREINEEIHKSFLESLQVDININTMNGALTISNGFRRMHGLKKN